MPINVHVNRGRTGVASCVRGWVSRGGCVCRPLNVRVVFASLNMVKAQGVHQAGRGVQLIDSHREV